MKISEIIRQAGKRPDVIHHKQMQECRLDARGARDCIERISQILPTLVEKKDISVYAAKQLSNLLPGFQKVLRLILWEIEYNLEQRRTNNDW